MLQVWEALGLYILNTPIYWAVVLLGSIIAYVSFKMTRDFSALFLRRTYKTPSNETFVPKLPLAFHVARTPSCWPIVMLTFIVMGVSMKLLTDILARFLRKPSVA
jgi:hypothetical protein